MKKICIITTRHISYNPRVLKEADALFENGFDVSVVTVNNDSRQRQFDEELMKTRGWKLQTANFRKEYKAEKARWLYLSLKQKLSIFLSGITLRYGIAERAAEKAFDDLVRLARAEKADFYLVHHSEALGVGFKAARARKVPFGFDAEDFHTDMNDLVGLKKATFGYLEKKYLPHSSYLSAASDGIAKAYQEKYNIPLPVTLLNVFPGESLPVREPGRSIRFYWYSQVIGTNRGLEMLLAAAGILVRSLATDGASAGPSSGQSSGNPADRSSIGSTAGQSSSGDPLPFELHIRGSMQNEDYIKELKALAIREGVLARLFLHEPILAQDLIADGNFFDVGLALELNTSVNANVCVSNKLFSYLMSGLAVIATDTAGQKDMLQQFPAVGRVCRMNDAEDLAGAMKFYILHRDRLMEAKKEARKAAGTQLNWEYESRKLLSAIKKIV